MGTEIERKFLVVSNEWQQHIFRKTKICQAYLCTDKARTVRVRITDDSAFLTIKGKTQGITRKEFEYPIPVSDAEALLPLTVTSPIEKIRFEVRAQNNLIWEIDVFQKENQGLVLAEIELPSEETEFNTPEWLGEEVSHDSRYQNSSLSLKPFLEW